MNPSPLTPMPDTPDSNAPPAILDLDELPEIPIVVTGYLDDPFTSNEPDLRSKEEIFESFLPVTNGQCYMQITFELRGSLLRGFVSAKNHVECRFDAPGREDIRGQVLTLHGWTTLMGFTAFIVEPPMKKHPKDRALIMTNIPADTHVYGRQAYPPD